MRRAIIFFAYMHRAPDMRLIQGAGVQRRLPFSYYEQLSSNQRKSTETVSEYCDEIIFADLKLLFLIY